MSGLLLDTANPDDFAGLPVLIPVPRAAELLGMPVPEVMNRATIAGAIEIGRHPGVVQVTFRAPAERLEACGLLGYAVEQYGER